MDVAKNSFWTRAFLLILWYQSVSVFLYVYTLVSFVGVLCPLLFHLMWVGFLAFISQLGVCCTFQKRG